MKRLIGSLLIVVLVATSITSYYFFKNMREDKKQEKVFNELENIIKSDMNDDVDVDVNEEKEQNIIDTSNIDNTKIEKVEKEPNLMELYLQNKDFVGWLKIDGTVISYPIMQNGTYYLRKNFYKNYSRYGTPFLAEYCNINTSENLIIYGHNINNGNMFADLVKYRNKSFYKNHKIVKMYFLQENKTIQKNYEIISVFEIGLESSFKYYSCYEFESQAEFEYFYNKIKELSIYETDNFAYYGDKFITLSTCDYNLKNGRMVIVAKEI